MKMKTEARAAKEEGEGERIIVVGRVGEGVGAIDTKERGEGYAKGAHKYKCFRSCGIEIKTRRRRSTRRRRRRCKMK